MIDNTVDSAHQDYDRKIPILRNGHSTPVINGISSESSPYRKSSPPGSPVVMQRAGQKVSELVSKLEHNLQHPDTLPRGREIKPITMTQYYEYEESDMERVIPVRMSTGLQRPQTTAPPRIVSNATREMDSLMTSLSDYKVMMS